MYHRILVTLDGSELAEQVLPHVKALIERQSGVQVYLFSVAQVVDLAAATAMVYPMAVFPGKPVDETAERRRVEDELCDYLHNVELHLAREGVQVTREVRFGRPAEE